MKRSRRRSDRPGVMGLRTEAQRRAIASPLRLELLGLFVDDEPLSVAQMAERMGRPASAIHYHVRILEKAGILKRAGESPATRRPRALYRPAADRFQVEKRRGEGSGEKATMRTVASVFRIAERDMEAALKNPRSRTRGSHRNVMVSRIHCRMSGNELARLNRHLQAIETLLSKVHKQHEPRPGDHFIALTLALTPLRNREA